MLVRIVLQGELGDRLSPYYRRSAMFVELREHIGKVEVELTSKLQVTLKEVWPEVEVIMMFVWPSDGAPNKDRIRYIKKERTFEVSTVVICEKPRWAQDAHGCAAELKTRLIRKLGEGLARLKRNTVTIDALLLRPL